MDDALLKAGAEAICEISSAMFKATGEAMKRHGNDPNSNAILLAAIAMFVGNIDRHIEPGFQAKVVMMLDPVGQTRGSS